MESSKRLMAQTRDQDVPAAPGRERPAPGPRHATATTALLAATALGLLSACNRAAEPPAPEERPVRAITIEKRAAGETIALTGSIQAQTEINLSFRIDGRMLERLVNIGDTVRPGQLIARLDSQNEESSLLAARAQLTAARAQLSEARNNFTRFRDLVAENAVSRASFEQAESALKGAESQVESAQAQVNIAQNRLGYTRLVADSAGVVTAVGAEPGEVVQAGRVVVQVARQGGRDAVFDVPPQFKDFAPANPEITVALATDPKVTAAGRVREVSPRADPATGTFRVARVGLTATRRDAAGHHGHRAHGSRQHRGHRDSRVGAVAQRQQHVGMDCRSEDPDRVHAHDRGAALRSRPRAGRQGPRRR